MLRRADAVRLAVLVCFWGSAAHAVEVRGGGSKSTDCIAVIDADGANSPAPPKDPRDVDCVDGSACDADGLRNARCEFTLRLCVNSTHVAACTPGRADSLDIEHAIDNGDPRFDTDFQALQQRTSHFGFPDDESTDDCALGSAITVPLRLPSSAGGAYKANKKQLRYTSVGVAGGRNTKDKDKMKFTCRPEGDGRYSPRDLYTGTFDRISQQVFATSCALSSCHDSESHRANMILLPGAAYSEIVNVAPTTDHPATDGMHRITPGDPSTSFLYLKIHERPIPPELAPSMPLIGQDVSDQLQEIIRLWIIGDGTLGPAPETGWVDGTDQ
jgi:hypothetical protein